MLRTLICCALALLWTPAFAETGPQDIDCIKPLQSSLDLTATIYRGFAAQAFLAALLHTMNNPPPLRPEKVSAIGTYVVAEAGSALVVLYDGMDCAFWAVSGPVEALQGTLRKMGQAL